MSVDVAALPAATEPRKLSHRLTRAGWAAFVSLVLMLSDGPLRASSSGWARLVGFELMALAFVLASYSYLGLRRYLTWHKFTKPRLILGVFAWLAIVSGVVGMVILALGGLIGSFPDATPAATSRGDLVYSLGSILFALVAVVTGVMILLGPLPLFGLKQVFGLALILGGVMPSSIPYAPAIVSIVQQVALGIILLRAADEVKASGHV